MVLPKSSRIAHTKLYNASQKVSEPDWNDRKSVKAWRDTHYLLLTCMEQIITEALSKGVFNG